MLKKYTKIIAYILGTSFSMIMTAKGTLKLSRLLQERQVGLTIKTLDGTEIMKTNLSLEQVETYDLRAIMLGLQVKGNCFFVNPQKEHIYPEDSLHSLVRNGLIELTLVHTPVEQFMLNRIVANAIAGFKSNTIFPLLPDEGTRWARLKPDLDKFRTLFAAQDKAAFEKQLRDYVTDLAKDRPRLLDLLNQSLKLRFYEYFEYYKYYKSGSSLSLNSKRLMILLYYALKNEEPFVQLVKVKYPNRETREYQLNQRVGLNIALSRYNPDWPQFEAYTTGGKKLNDLSSLVELRLDKVSDLTLIAKPKIGA